MQCIVLQTLCDGFPSAHGLSISFSSKTGYRYDTPTIHNSSKAMSLALGNLGFATCTFEDCSLNETLQIFEAISKVNFGPSYKCIFIHWTGHGRKGYIKVTDGEISINELKTILSARKAPTLKNMVKILFYDCCRTKVCTDESLEQTTTEPNLVTVFSVPLNQQALMLTHEMLTHEGMGIATKELIQLLLEKQTDSNLLTLLSINLTNKIKEAGLQISKSLDLRTDFEGSLSFETVLYKNKKKSSKLVCTLDLVILFLFDN